MTLKIVIQLDCTVDLFLVIPFGFYGKQALNKIFFFHDLKLQSQMRRPRLHSSYGP